MRCIFSFMPVYDLKLASSFDECGKLRDYLAVMADREGFSQAFFEELELVVKEAFVNAVRHGNGTDNEDVPVMLHFDSFTDESGSILLIEVADSGSGFAMHEIVNPTLSSHRMKLSGRGVFLIGCFAEFMDLVCDETGCRLTLRMRPY